MTVKAGDLPPFPDDEALEQLTLVIDGTPEAGHLAIPFHLHRIAMPPPLHRFVARIDAALEKQVLNIAQRQGYRTYSITTCLITSGEE